MGRHVLLFNGRERDTSSCTCGLSVSMWQFDRKKYANESKRPLFRGWIHAAVTIVLVQSFIGVSAAVASGALPVRWWRMCGLLLGKLASYAASASYHLHPSKSLAIEIGLLKFDLVAISIAIWAPCSPFAMKIPEWLTLFGIMAGVTFLNWRAVEHQFSSIGGSPLQRSALLLAYFAFTVGQIGWHYGYRGLWFAGVASYVLGFCVSPHVHHHLPRAPWHIEHCNSWHEDFHLLLAAADAFFTAMAAEFLQNPNIDARP